MKTAENWVPQPEIAEGYLTHIGQDVARLRAFHGSQDKLLKHGSDPRAAFLHSLIDRSIKSVTYDQYGGPQASLVDKIDDEEAAEILDVAGEFGLSKLLLEAGEGFGIAHAIAEIYRGTQLSNVKDQKFRLKALVSGVVVCQAATLFSQGLPLVPDPISPHTRKLEKGEVFEGPLNMVATSPLHGGVIRQESNWSRKHPSVVLSRLVMPNGNRQVELEIFARQAA